MQGSFEKEIWEKKGYRRSLVNTYGVIFVVFFFLKKGIFVKEKKSRYTLRKIALSKKKCE